MPCFEPATGVLLWLPSCSYTKHLQHSIDWQICDGMVFVDTKFANCCSMLVAAWHLGQFRFTPQSIDLAHCIDPATVLQAASSEKRPPALTIWYHIASAEQHFTVLFTETLISKRLHASDTGPV